MQFGGKFRHKNTLIHSNFLLDMLGMNTTTNVGVILLRDATKKALLKAHIQLYTEKLTDELEARVRELEEEAAKRRKM